MSCSKETPAVAPHATLEQLDKVLSSRVFQGSERATKLLRFLVERAADGQSDRLKEYIVGTEGLGKGHSFDPRTDPIVRSEVSRLRTRLDKYYAAEGRTDLIVITLPKGSYVPRFQSRTIPPASTPGVIEGRPSPIASRLRAPLAVLAGVSIAAAIAFMSYRAYALLTPRQGIVAERAVSASEASAVSIAVLPFLNLSGDASQEFFSDGMTEEITAALAKIRDLKVVARTSAFQFKAQNRDIQSIGQQLHATHLIEGSVRKDGDHVRIIAQLIEAKSGVRLSSESYDRKIDDILSAQEEIARNIVGTLMAPLGLAAGERLISQRPVDEQTYELFLRGRAAFRARKPEALKLLEQVVARDPNFAPGWMFYGESHFFKISNEEIENAARTAIRLDPNYSGGYALLATVNNVRGNYSGAMDLIKQALERDPDDPEALFLYGTWLWTLGYLKEALAAQERVHLLEPLIPLYNKQRDKMLAANGMTDSAVGEWTRTRSDFIAWDLLAPAAAQLGHFDDAIDALQGASPAAFGGRTTPVDFAQPLVASATQVLRAAANGTTPPAKLPDFNSELNFVYAYTSAPDRMLDWPEKAVKEKKGPWPQVLRTVWWPAPSSVRKTERFKKLVRDAGLVDYWKVRGWPDLCRPVGAGDFVCD